MHPSEDAAAAAPTIDLLGRVRAGDARAREILLARYLPRLRRWAHGRLPDHARGLADTEDVVQIAMIRALSHLGDFVPEHEGALIGYLRQAVMNAVRDEIRRARRRPQGEEITEAVVDPAPSLLEEAIGAEMLERYEAALAALPDDHREAVILRLEFGFTYPQIAEALARPSVDATRMLVTRALARVAETMHAGRHDSGAA